MDFNFLFLDRDRGARQRILRLVSGTADWHVGRIYGARLLPVLRLLGSHAGTDVPADWYLGRAAETLRRLEVLLVHAARFGPDAACNAVPIFQTPLHHRPVPIHDS